jgi:hypothetical protein
MVYIEAVSKVYKENKVNIRFMIEEKLCWLMLIFLFLFKQLKRLDHLKKKSYIKVV